VSYPFGLTPAHAQFGKPRVKKSDSTNPSSRADLECGATYYAMGLR